MAATLGATPFSPGEIAKLRDLAERGYGSATISKVLGKKPAAIKNKCTALGIALKRPSSSNRLRLTPDLMVRLRIEARNMACSPTQLARDLLSDLLLARDRSEKVKAVLTAKAKAVKADDVVVIFTPPQPRVSPALSALGQPMLIGQIS